MEQSAACEEAGEDPVGTRGNTGGLRWRLRRREKAAQPHLAPSYGCPFSATHESITTHLLSAQPHLAALKGVVVGQQRHVGRLSALALQAHRDAWRAGGGGTGTGEGAGHCNEERAWRAQMTCATGRGLMRLGGAEEKGSPASVPAFLSALKGEKEGGE
jgi:hypothetical protein